MAAPGLRCRNGRVPVELSRTMKPIDISENIARYRSFAIQQNIVRYSKLLQSAVDEGSRRTIALLLAKEEAKLKSLGLNGRAGKGACRSKTAARS